MPNLRLFSGIRYADTKDDLTTRIAPPYDVLDEGPKQELLARDPHNIVAIDLPVTPPKTLGPDEAYARAGEVFRKWIAKGVLKQESEPAVYAYEQTYTVNGKYFARRGLLTTLEVEEFGRSGGGIHRHELTIKGGTDDRLKLMEATAAQLSPVFGIFSDADRVVAQALNAYFHGAEPDFFGTTSNDNVQHRCWIVRDEEVIRKLAAFFKQTDVFIADGHHRYTTALNYHKAHPDELNSAGCLFFVCALQDPGMIVLPTHRVVCGLTNFTMDALRAAAEKHGGMKFQPTQHGQAGLDQLAAELPSHPHHAMGVLDPHGGQTWLLTFNDRDPLAKIITDKPAVWRELDVAILQHLVVEKLLKPSFGGDGLSLKYPQIENVAHVCNDAPGRVAFIVQPTPLHSVCDVSLAGEVMPPKSTFFFPKLATGLVINPLW